MHIIPNIGNASSYNWEPTNTIYSKETVLGCINNKRLSLAMHLEYYRLFNKIKRNKGAIQYNQGTAWQRLQISAR